MNTRSEAIITSPQGTLESCAKFAIDDTATPFIFRKLEIEGEGEYIFSGYIKADASATLKIRDQTVSVTTGWQKIEVTLTLSADKLFLYFGAVTNFYLYHPVLVAGKIAHRWISHPDDFSTVETRLYQTEEGLKSTVKKGSIISEINQTAESVGIKANNFLLTRLLRGVTATYCDSLTIYCYILFFVFNCFNSWPNIRFLELKSRRTFRYFLIIGGSPVIQSSRLPDHMSLLRQYVLPAFANDCPDNKISNYPVPDQ